MEQAIDPRRIRTAARVTFGALVFGELAGAGAVLFARSQGLLETQGAAGMEQALSIAAAAVLFVAVVLRRVLVTRVISARGAQRMQRAFVAFMVPLTLIEGGCLISLVNWLLHPSAVVPPGMALILFLATLTYGRSGLRILNAAGAAEEDEEVQHG